MRFSNRNFMKMKNIFKSILIGISTIAMAASCNLELEPTSEIVFDEKEPLLLTQSDIVSFQNGVLASYRSTFSGTYDQSADVMCDYFNATITYGNNYGSVHRADETFTDSDEYVESLWGTHYLAIKDYNIAIEQAEMVEDESLLPYANLLKGISLFCRASSYLTLTRYFGPAYNEDTAEDDLSVPLIISYDYEAEPYRATVEEVYEQILTDLLEAEELLTEAATNLDPGFSGFGNCTMPTVDAVKALLARYYLDTKDYSSAAKTAIEVINSTGGYTLANTVSAMHNEYLTAAVDGQQQQPPFSGTEAILALPAMISEGRIFKAIYTNVTSDENGTCFTPYFLPSANAISAYDDADLRRRTWFSTGLHPVKTVGYTDDVIVFVKYIGTIGSPNNPFNTSSLENSAVAAKPIRISEMYLIAAEAYACLNNNTRAKSWLNKLQEARSATLTGGSLENVKKEWFRETIGDGQRLICLKRWGDGIPARVAQEEAENIVMTGTAYDERVVDADSRIFTWPIPAYELTMTPTLGQNPGY